MLQVGNKNLVGLGVEALKGTSGKPSLPPDELQHDVALLQRHRLCSYIENIGETGARHRLCTSGCRLSGMCSLTVMFFSSQKLCRPGSLPSSVFLPEV